MKHIKTVLTILVLALLLIIMGGYTCIIARAESSTPISPWFFYFLSFANGMKMFTGVAAIIITLCLLVAAIEEAHSTKTWLLWFRIDIFLIILAILIPSQETMLTMQVASLVTEENLTGAYDLIINTTQTILNGS